MSLQIADVKYDKIDFDTLILNSTPEELENITAAVIHSFQHLHIDLTRYHSFCVKLEQHAHNINDAKVTEIYYKAINNLKLDPRANHLLTYFSDFLVDGNHPWKEERYLCVLKKIHESIINQQLCIHDCSKKLQKIINCYLDHVSDLPPSALYRKWLFNLREALLVDQPDQRIDQILHQIAYIRYTKTNIFPFLKRLVILLIHSGLRVLPQFKNEVDDETFLENLLSLPLNIQYQAISHAPQNFKSSKTALFLQRAKGGLNLYYDPQSEQNLPYTFYEMQFINQLKETHPVRFLRFGTPTQQRNNFETMTWQGEAHIIPEFYAFIKTLHKNSQRYVFINLQDQKSRYFANEYQRCEVIKSLHKVFPDTFFYVSLAQDSAFYNQTGEYLNCNKSFDFKSKLIDQFFSSKNPDCHLPNSWIVQSEFVETIIQLSNAIHHAIFQDAEYLDDTERLDFIEIFYAVASFYFIQYNQPHFFSFCCKDSADRSGKNQTLLLQVALILMEQDQSIEMLSMRNVYLHAAPFIVKQREMNFRWNRLISAIKRLENQDNSQRLRQSLLKYLNPPGHIEYNFFD